MKELWQQYGDYILATLLVSVAIGFGIGGGMALFHWVKWPFAVAVIMGIAFMLGNDGAHAIKRLIRDKAIPWVKAKIKR